MGDEIKSKILQRLVNDLRAAHGENLASATLYGSVAAGDHTEGRSDHNVLIVLRQITVADLRQAQPAIRAWTRSGQPMPVYFSVDELKRAADVFPIEFLQMEKARKILYGSDPFEYVEISRANLRHQTEYELRTKFLQLRRLYIPASGSAAKLTALMTDSLASFAALFRAVLMLMNQDPPVAKAVAVHATVKLLGLDGAPFERILELRAGSKTALTDKEANDLFDAYLTQIEQVIDAVDQIERQ
jgi:hypothetical protein